MSESHAPGETGHAAGARPNETTTPKAEEDDRKPGELRAEDFMPPPGSMRELVELQLGMLTRAVLESAIYSTGALDDLPETLPFAKTYPPYERRTRTEELKTSARMAHASAALIAAYARAHRAIHPHYTHRHTVRTDAAGKILGRTTQITSQIPHQSGLFFEPENGETEGSNATP